MDPTETRGIPLEHYRLLHSTAHVMAAAVRRLWPDAKLTVGSPIARPFRGFYQDIDLERRLTAADLPRIARAMETIVDEDAPFLTEQVSKEAAIELFRSLGQEHKLAMIEAGAAGGEEEGVEEDRVSIYRSGDFTDLCDGPHVASTGSCRHFKLLHVSETRLPGDPSPKRIQRIYGTAWPTREELIRDVARHESAAERDHRRIGKELKLFQRHPEAPGSVFWLPRGTVIHDVLARKMRELLAANGYVEVRTPLLVHKSLWETSGRWDAIRGELFLFGEGEEVFALKPMSCPSHMLIYRSERRSCRELPLRIHEQGILHRREDPDAIEGLRGTCPSCGDESHIFLRPDQVEPEIAARIGLVRRVYGAFGIDFRVHVGTSAGEEHPESRPGSREQRAQAQAAVRRALEQNGLEHETDRSQAASCGPRIDFVVRNVFGVFEHRCATIQLDFDLPERFGLEYVDVDNTRKRPIVVHGTIYGGFERFIATLIEHTAGKLPLWLAPVQVKVLTISDAHAEYGARVRDRLVRAGIRAELDDRADKIPFKVRAAALEKVPWTAIVGGRERDSGTVSVSGRDGRDRPEIVDLETFVSRVAAEAATSY